MTKIIMFDKVVGYFNEREQAKINMLVARNQEAVDYALAFLELNWFTFVSFDEVYDALKINYMTDTWEERRDDVYGMRISYFIQVIRNAFTNAWYQYLEYDYLEREFNVINPNWNKESFNMASAVAYFNIN